MGLTRAQRYGTHIPVLVKVVMATKGPVLELGCGFASTSLLFWLCQMQGRKFVSYENDPGWIKQVGYPVIFTEDWNKIDIDNIHWSVAFIDHRPGERRIIEAIRLEDKADIIILHDSEPESDKYYQYEKIYPMFKYRYDYKEFLPHTVALSNKINLNKIFK